MLLMKGTSFIINNEEYVDLVACTKSSVTNADRSDSIPHGPARSPVPNSTTTNSDTSAELLVWPVTE